VARLLQSLRAQSLDPCVVEVFVISNFQDSLLEKVIVDFQGRWNGTLQLKSVGRLGVNSARNLGLELCSSPLVLLLDDDCILPGPGYLQNVIDLHRKNPRAIAAGGAYFSNARAGRVSRHYNQICNQWVSAQFQGVSPAQRLLGGCTSYNIDLMRAHGFRFCDEIIYGGSETELHERMVESGHILLFDPGHSVIHDCQVSFLGLIRKAAMQGRTKGRLVGERKASVKASHEDASFCKFIYRCAFKAGQRLGRTNSRISNAIFFLTAFYCALFPLEKICEGLSTVYWLAYRVVSGLRGEVRKLALNSYWTLKSVATRSYWLLYAGLSSAKGRYRRDASAIYWFCYRLLSRTYWRLMRLKGIFRERRIQLYWSTYHRAHQVKGYYFFWRGRIRRIAIHWYWTFYPILNHLKKNWPTPRSLLNIKMPLTYPNFETSTAPLWVARLNEAQSDSVSTEQIKKWKSLGISAVEFRAENISRAQVAHLAAFGLGSHIMIPALSDFSPSAVVRGSRPFAVVQISQINAQGDAVLEWLKHWPELPAMQIRLDVEPRARASARFFSQLKELNPAPQMSLVLPSARVTDQAARFKLFRRLHRFAAQVERFSFSWSPYYRYVQDNHHKAVSCATNFDGAKTHPPQVSVVIPHHRDFDNLCLVLRHLSHQTLSAADFEVIVVDNASPRDLLSEEQRHQLMKLAERMSFTLITVESANREVYLAGHARNEGLIRAHGKYIQFIDSDILLPPDFLQSLIAHMQNADVFMAKRHMLRAGAQPDPESSLIDLKNVYREEDYWEGFKSAKEWTDLPDYWKYSCTYCLAAKREDLLKAGPFDPRFTNYGFEDVDLGFRLYKMRLRFAFLPLWVAHLYPRRDLHNYHFDLAKRARNLEISALTLFQLRPEKPTFALCQGYFAPRLSQWIMGWW